MEEVKTTADFEEPMAENFWERMARNWWRLPLVVLLFNLVRFQFS